MRVNLLLSLFIITVCTVSAIPLHPEPRPLPQPLPLPPNQPVVTLQASVAPSQPYINQKSVHSTGPSPQQDEGNGDSAESSSPGASVPILNVTSTEIPMATAEVNAIGKPVAASLQLPALALPSSSPNAAHSQPTPSLVKPFSVTIDNAKFYGGLVTYTHHLHPARICRVLNGCIRSDGTLLLPAWMQRHDSVIAFHCGQPKVEFSLPDTMPPLSLYSADLVGLNVPRPSMPDFIVDFLPNAVVFDLIYGLHQSVNKVCHSRKGEGCDGFPGLADALRAAVILPHRLSLFDEKKSWAREFVKLMKPPQVGRQPKVLYDNQLYQNGSDTMCFRSALFTRGPFNKNHIMADHIRNIHFLDLHGIEKKSRNVLTDAAAQGISKRRQCTLNVTITNRKLVDGALNRLVGRYIVNIAGLKQAVIKQAKRIPGLVLSVDTLTLEGRSLRWQINAMQKTDVLVAGHGPLLTNMIFMRENSTVVELQPFTYYPPTYEQMAVRLAHVRYDRYIAHPDVEAFRTCMNQLFPPSHFAHKPAMQMLSKFTQAAQKYQQSDSTHTLVIHGLNEEGLQAVKTCAQMQRLDFDAEKLAIAIVRQARLRCGYSHPNAS